MHRRIERHVTSFWRRTITRHIKPIMTVVLGFIAFNLIFYLSVKTVFFPPKPTATQPSTSTTTSSTTTTVTTTLEVTTKKSFSKI